MDRKRVVYLFGAGATQGCLDFLGVKVGLLMTHLNPILLEKLRKHIKEEHAAHDGLNALAFGVLDDQTDYEQVMTFLEQSPSELHHRLAHHARGIFREVLTEELETAVERNGGDPPILLYQALLDLHAIKDFPEVCSGLLTLNYDGFLEKAVESTSHSVVDWCMAVEGVATPSGDRVALPLVKLHGSFGWTDSFPVQLLSAGKDAAPLWIPPGVVKEKHRYPFNTLWGRARELLDCDVVRIVGWNMGPNDWDLISLLFSTRHGNDLRGGFELELISSPETAIRLNKEFPYLGVKSILESARAGRELIAEYTGAPSSEYSRLSAEEQARAVKAAGKRRNWFLDWLKQNLEWAHINLSIDPALKSAMRVLEDVA